MEVIYPRDSRKDSESSGTVGSTVPVVDGGIINQTFYDWLTQYFNEDNRKSIIETINNYYQQMPDVGINDLLFAYMAKFEIELKAIKEAIKNIDLGTQLIENHTVYNFGDYTWNNHTENIYMLTGGVPATITINQYINNICGVAIFGSEFKTLDAATGAINISLYPVDYLQTLLDNNTILVIGGGKYVPLTICELTINDNELGDQLGNIVETSDDTSVESVPFDFGFLYNFFALSNESGLIKNGWRYVSRNDLWNSLDPFNNVGSSAAKCCSSDSKYWNNVGTNEYGINLMGVGERASNGGFSGRKVLGDFWTGEMTSTIGYIASVRPGVNWGEGSISKHKGHVVIVVRDVVDGENEGDFINSAYVGNDGKSYDAIVSHGLVWLLKGLQETKYNDGTDVPNITDNAAWGVDVIGAYCVYDNEPDKKIINGGVTVVSGDTLSNFSVDAGNGFNEPKEFSELDHRFLSSLFLRKI